MLEAAGVPVLVAAINFLFGEASKVLQERRERKRQDQPSDSTSGTEAQDKGEQVAADAISTKEEGLRQEVDKARLSANEADIHHLLSLLKIQSRNYQLAEEQYALWGKGLVPQIIVHNLEEAENGVADTTQKLQDKLSTVYGKPVVVPDLSAD
jgi:hypothetical protein